MLKNKSVIFLIVKPKWEKWGQAPFSSVMRATEGRVTISQFK